MPCHSAKIENAITVSPDTTVEKAMALLSKEKADFLAVIDDSQKLLGYFSAATLLQNILPVAVDMSTGLQLDITLGAAPGVAKRLNNAKLTAIQEVMNNKPRVVYSETPTWEGVKILVEHGAPLFITEEGTGKFLGIMTEKSAIEDLERSMQD